MGVERLDDKLGLVAATDGTAVVAVGRGSGLLQGRHASLVDEDDADEKSQAESNHVEALGHLMGRTPAHRHDVGQRPPRHHKHGKNTDALNSLSQIERYLTHSNLSEKFYDAILCIARFAVRQEGRY